MTIPGVGQSVLTPNVINQPIFNSRKVTTSVSVWDGQTVVLGGLMREDVQKTEDRTPIIGDIPLVGRLFRTNTEQHIKRNLVIFVTARLVNPAGQPVNSSEEEEETETVSQLEPPVLPQVPILQKIAWLSGSPVASPPASPRFAIVSANLGFASQTSYLTLTRPVPLPPKLLVTVTLSGLVIPVILALYLPPPLLVIVPRTAPVLVTVTVNVAVWLLSVACTVSWLRAVIYCARVTLTVSTALVTMTDPTIPQQRPWTEQ